MNDKRRGILKKAVSYLERASELVSEALEQEQDCYDNTPENLQSSDRYEAMESAIDSLEDAISSIDEAKEKIENASE